MLFAPACASRYKRRKFFPQPPSTGVPACLIVPQVPGFGNEEVLRHDSC